MHDIVAGSKPLRRATCGGLLVLLIMGLWLIVSSQGALGPSNSAGEGIGADRSHQHASQARPNGRHESIDKPSARERPRTSLPAAHTPARGEPVARVKIPAIGVDAPMIKLGLNPDRTLEVPADAFETGWWSGGSFPGDHGPAVIAGHVESRGGPAVFFRLDELEAGDEVRVTRPNGETTRFVVVRQERVPKEDFPTRRVYAPTSRPTLRVVTCTGDFDEARGRYRSNLIVFARRL